MPLSWCPPKDWQCTKVSVHLQPTYKLPADRFSLVEVPGELAEHVITSLQGVRFRGRSVVVRLDKAGNAV